MKLILGSNSPRRKEILGYFNLPFEVRPSNFDEDSLPFEGDPVAYVRALANGKAKAIKSEEHEIVLTADTIVYRDGKVYGKPSSGAEAFSTLKELVGTWHTVYTGITLKRGKDLWDDIEETRVLFNSPTDQQLEAYHTSLHCTDKAGGYAIQEAGALMVRSIEGCYYNVMGLPINGVHKLLSQVGVSLWDHLS